MRKRISEVWNAIKTIIQSKDYTPRESVMAIIAVFLFGMFLGILVAPKKEITVGSNNGNNNVGYGSTTNDGGKAKEDSQKAEDSHKEQEEK